MNKAEIQLLHNSIQAEAIEAMQKFSEADSVWRCAHEKAPNELPPQEETEKLASLHHDFMTALTLLAVLEKPMPRNSTRESLLILSYEMFKSTCPNTFERFGCEDILKSVATLLDSIPTPEMLTAGSIDKSSAVSIKNTHST